MTQHEQSDGDGTSVRAKIREIEERLERIRQNLREIRTRLGNIENRLKDIQDQQQQDEFTASGSYGSAYSA